MYSDQSLSQLGVDLQTDYQLWLAQFAGWADIGLSSGDQDDSLAAATNVLLAVIRSALDFAGLEAWLNSGYISGVVPFPLSQTVSIEGRESGTGNRGAERESAERDTRNQNLGNGNWPTQSGRQGVANSELGSVRPESDAWEPRFAEWGVARESRDLEAAAQRLGFGSDEIDSSVTREQATSGVSTIPYGSHQLEAGNREPGETDAGLPIAPEQATSGIRAVPYGSDQLGVENREPGETDTGLSSAPEQAESRLRSVPIPVAQPPTSIASLRDLARHLQATPYAGSVSQADAERVSRVADKLSKPRNAEAESDSQADAERVSRVADELSEVRNAEIEGDSSELGAERLHRVLQTPGFEAEPDRLSLDTLTQLGHTLAAELNSLDAIPAGLPDHAPPPANPATSVARLRQLIAALPLRTARFDRPHAIKDEGTVAEPPTTIPPPQCLPTSPASLVAASMPERIPNVAAQPNLARAELELHDILDALAREIEREYRRFYGT